MLDEAMQSNDALVILGVTIEPGKPIKVEVVENAFKSRKTALEKLGKAHVKRAREDYQRCLAALDCLRHGKRTLPRNGNGKSPEGHSGNGKHPVAKTTESTHQAVEKQVPGVVKKEAKEEQPTHASESGGGMLNRIGKSRVGIAAAGVAGAAAAVIGWAVTRENAPQWEKAKEVPPPAPAAVKEISKEEISRQQPIKNLPPSSPFDPTAIEKPKPAEKPAPIIEVKVPLTVVEEKPAPKPEPKPVAPVIQAPPKETKPVEIAVVQPKSPSQEGQAAKPTSPANLKPAKISEGDVIEKSKKELATIRELQMDLKELLRELGKTPDPAQKYAICMVAIEKAKAEADIPSLRAAFAALRNNFENEDSFFAFESKTIMALASARSAKSEYLTSWALALMLQACQEDQYDIAISLGGARGLQGKLPAKNALGQRRSLVAATKEATALKRQSEGLEDMRKTLESNRSPDDSDANHAMGMYLLEVASPAALGHLSKSREVGALARETLKRGDMNAQQLMELAQKWAATPGALNRTGVVHLIAELLDGAQQKAGEGIAGKTIQKRAGELKSQYCNKTSLLLEGTSLESGRPMRTVDIAKWLGQMNPVDKQKFVSHDGRGSLQPGIATIGNERVSALQAKSNVRLSCPDFQNVTVYKARAMIVPQGKNDPIQVNLPVGPTSVTLLIDGVRGEINFCDNQDRPIMNDAEQKSAIGPLKTGQEYLLSIEVSEGARPQEISIRVFLSEKGGAPKSVASLNREIQTLAPLQGQFRNKNYFGIFFAGDYALPELSIQLPR